MVAESGAGEGVRLWGRRLGARSPEGPGPKATWGGCTGVQPDNRGLHRDQGQVCPHQQREPAELLPKANSTPNLCVSELMRGHVGSGDQPAPQQSRVCAGLV